MLVWLSSHWPRACHHFKVFHQWSLQLDDCNIHRGSTIGDTGDYKEFGQEQQNYCYDWTNYEEYEGPNAGPVDVLQDLIFTTRATVKTEFLCLQSNEKSYLSESYPQSCWLQGIPSRLYNGWSIHPTTLLATTFVPSILYTYSSFYCCVPINWSISLNHHFKHLIHPYPPCFPYLSSTLASLYQSIASSIHLLLDQAIFHSSTHPIHPSTLHPNPTTNLFDPFNHLFHPFIQPAKRSTDPMNFWHAMTDPETSTWLEGEHH